MIIRRHHNQSYTTLFNPNTGFFARIEDKGMPEVFWSESGPELLDISITNWCDKGCAFCYRKSDINGAEMSVSDYRYVMDQASKSGVMQVALGGGNPNQHSEFSTILGMTREEFGIVPNYTTNGRGLTKEVLLATQRYCGAVAVSAYEPFNETLRAVTLLKDYGVKVNLHYILNSKSVGKAIEWLDTPPKLLQNITALIFLNYKPIGRHQSDELLLNKSNRLKEFFDMATRRKYHFKVGFDTCTATGLSRFGQFADVSSEGCDAGRFSLFISEDLMVYPCSFMVETAYPGISLRGRELGEIWKNGEEFVSFRAHHAGGGCSDCPSPQNCLAGCPLFPQMNLCASNCCH